MRKRKRAKRMSVCLNMYEPLKMKETEYQRKRDEVHSTHSACHSMTVISFLNSIRIWIAWRHKLREHKINVTLFLLFFPTLNFFYDDDDLLDVQPQLDEHAYTLCSTSTHETVSPVVEPFAFSSDVVAGRRAGVACIVSAGDLPITIEWLKDGRPLEPGLAATISTSDFTSFLSFPRLTRAHTGNYTCRAENPAAGSEFTAPMRVQGLFNCFFSYCLLYSSTSHDVVMIWKNSEQKST